MNSVKNPTEGNFTLNFLTTHVEMRVLIDAGEFKPDPIEINHILMLKELTEHKPNGTYPQPSQPQTSMSPDSDSSKTPALVPADGKKPSRGKLIGLVVGAVLFTLLLIGLIVFFTVRSSKRKKEDPIEQPAIPPKPRPNKANNNQSNQKPSISSTRSAIKL